MVVHITSLIKKTIFWTNLIMINIIIYTGFLSKKLRFTSENTMAYTFYFQYTYKKKYKAKMRMHECEKKCIFLD